MSIKWRDVYATGVDAIDEQHKELFRRVDALLEACKQGKAHEEVEGIMNFMEEYVVSHFSSEEKYMERYDYPDAGAHKKLHAEFMENVRHLSERFKSMGPTLGFVAKVNPLVVDWLLKHVCGEDKKFASYLKEQM